MRQLAFALLLLCPTAALAAPTVWVTHGTVKIQPDAAPGAGSSIALSAAQNEFEPFQIAVHADAAGLTNVRVQSFTLSGPGAATLDSSHIWMYREGLITTTQPSNQEVTAGTWPDALIPDVDETVHEQRNAFPFDVPPGENRVVWVDLLVPKGQTPGTYAGTVSLSGDGSFAATVDVSLQVWPFALPSTSSLPSTFGIGWDAACIGYYGSYNACGQDQGVITTQLQMVQFFLDHRVSIDSVYTGPGSSSSDPSGYDWATWDAIYAPYFDGTASTRLPGAKLTSIRYSWGGSSSQYGAWAAHFKARGWFDRTFDYTCDEPSPTNACTFSDIPGKVQNVWAGDPDFRTLVTTNIDEATSNGVAQYITQMTPIINEMEDKSGSYGGSQRARYDSYVQNGGKLFWYQSCESIGCGTPKSYDSYSTGWPSMMIDTPAMRNRAMEWLSFVYGLQGELYYETTYAMENGDAWTSQWYFGGNGDGTLVYNGTPAHIGGTTPVPVASIRLKLIREGMEDYEYLKMVSDLGDPTFAMQQALTVVTNTYTIDDDPTALYAARSALAQRIVQLMNPSATCSDGTAANACSTSQPQQCVGGQLVDACATCGCAGGLTCQADGSCSAQQPPGQYTAMHVAVTPTLDGQLAEYEGMPQLSVGNAKVQAGWDAQNLYLAFDVTDSDLVPSDGTEANLYSGDTVEVMIDPTGNGGASADSDDVHLLADVAGNLGDALGWTTFSYSSNAQVAVDLEGGALGGAAAGTGYRVELAIPWSAVGVAPADGVSFGFDVAVNDKSLAGNLTSADWMGLSGFNDPAGWGHLTLSATTPATSSSTSTSGTTGTTGSTGTTGTTGTTGSGTSTGSGIDTSSGGAGAGGTTGSQKSPKVSSGCASGGARVELFAVLALLGLVRRRR